MSAIVLAEPLRICDVHRLVDGDTMLRLCRYCNLCDSWICTECFGDWPKRALAATRRKLELARGGLKNLGHSLMSWISVTDDSTNDISATPAVQGTLLSGSNEDFLGALSFYPQDIFINMNGTSTGTAVTTSNLATGTQGTNTTWSTASAQETFAASRITMPANVTVNGTLFAANTATQSLAYDLTTAFTASKKSISGTHHFVTTSGWFYGPPSCGTCGTLYDLSYACGTTTFCSALQITPGSSAGCGQYAVRIEATHTAAHSGCININPTTLYFWSMYTDMSGGAGTCSPGSIASPCAELSIYSTNGATFTQVGSTVSVALNTAGTSDTLGYINYGNSEATTSSGNTMYFQNMMINYSNSVEGQPNVPH